MSKLYIVKYRTSTGARGVELMLHLPRPGKLWALDEATIVEVEPTGRTWMWDNAKRKVQPIQRTQTRAKRTTKKETSDA